MLNAWILWWNSEALLQGYAGYWDAPIFSPEPGTLAYSEPQPASVIVAPLVWLGSVPLAYNGVLLGALTLNGFFAFQFLKRAGCLSRIAVGGAAAITTQPIVLDSMEAIQLVPLFGILWTLQTILPCRTNQILVPSILLGLALATTALICLHHALFLCILLPALWVSRLVQLRHSDRRKCSERFPEQRGAETLSWSGKIVGRGRFTDRLRAFLIVGLGSLLFVLPHGSLHLFVTSDP